MFAEILKQGVFNKKVSRKKLLETVMQLEANSIVMEACYNSNHWGRTFLQYGLSVKLIPPHQVKPFVVDNKNDQNDTVAIAEASQRPRAVFVPVKTLEQQIFKAWIELEIAWFEQEQELQINLEVFLPSTVSYSIKKYLLYAHKCPM